MNILQKGCFAALPFSLMVTSSYALDSKPWLGNPWEFEFQTAFTYSHYHNIQGASVPLASPSNDRDLCFDLSVTPLPAIDGQVEVEFANTPRQPWGLRSAALQVRYQFLDDIAGDPLSVTAGLNARAVSKNSLRDVSSPYASNINGEVFVSLGKEWSHDAFWVMRTFGYAAAGIANRSYPWTIGKVVWEANLENHHRFVVFGVGDFGFGPKSHVDTDHFYGWGNYHHQSIDLGAGYTYKLGIWGCLSLDYAYRVFAKNFPEQAQFVCLSYRLPFSFL